MIRIDQIVSVVLEGGVTLYRLVLAVLDLF